MLVLVASFFIFRATSNFIAKATIFNPGGAPVFDNDTGTETDSTVLPGEPTPTVAVSLDNFDMPEAWDGKTRVNLLVMGLDARTIDANVVLTDDDPLRWIRFQHR